MAEEPIDPAVIGLPDALPGLDVRHGLARAVGKAELYRSLLQDVASTHGRDAERIGALLTAGDLKGGLDHVHALRGLAGNLGVNRVSDAAAALESAIRLEDSSQYDGRVGGRVGGGAGGHAQTIHGDDHRRRPREHPPVERLPCRRIRGSLRHLRPDWP